LLLVTIMVDVKAPLTANGRFRRFSHAVAGAVGKSWAFVLACAVVLLWALTGPMFHFSDTWQLVINTGTTIVTFLMVFLIQNTQNRDAQAIHLKLDELIKGVKGARNQFVSLEQYSDEELDRLQQEFNHLRKRACDELEERRSEREAVSNS
jgi:low affinity Fe/Cu permease